MLAAVGIVAALLVLLVAGTVIVVQTPFGEERVRRLLERHADEAVAGHVDIGSLSLSWRRIDLREIVLRDPERREVVRIPNLSVEYSPFALFGKKLDIRKLAVDRPSIELLVDDGLNLERALQPTTPKRQDAAAVLDWTVELKQLQVRSGTIRTASPRATLVHLEQLDVDGALCLELASASFAARLKVRGMSRRTLPGRLALDAAVSGRASLSSGDVRVRVGEALDLKVRLAGDVPSGISAWATVSIPRVRWQGADWGPLDVRVDMKRGVLEQLRMYAVGPGVQLRAQGAATGKGNSLREMLAGTVEIHDFAALRGAMARIGAELPQLAGSGLLRFDLSCQPTMRLASLGGNMTIDFGKSAAGKRRLNGFSLVVNLPAGSAASRPFSVAARLSGPVPVDFSAQGTRDKWEGGLPVVLQLDDLALAYGRRPVRWEEQGGATVTLGRRGVGLDGFNLTSGAQSLQVAMPAPGGSARVVISRFDTASLAPFAPALDKRFAGILDGRIDVRTMGGARVDGRLRLSHGRIGEVAPTSGGLDFKLNYRNDRIDGDVTLATPAGEVEGALDMPAAWPPAAGAPVRFSARARSIDLEAVGRMLSARMPRASGRANARVHLAGTAGQPQVRVTVALGKARLASPSTKGSRTDVPALERGQLELRYRDALARASAELDTQGGGRLKFDGRAKIKLALSDLPESLAASKRHGISGTLHLERFDTSWLAGLVEPLQGMGGDVNARFVVFGTLAAPRFRGTMRWQDGRLIAASPSPMSGRRPPATNRGPRRSRNSASPSPASPPAAAPAATPAE